MALPDRVRQIAEQNLGPVTLIRVHEGKGSDLAATLHTGSGVVFLKAINLSMPRSEIARVEARTAPHLPSTTGAPRLRWCHDDGAWLVMCFEHLMGRHADLSPDSPDLPLIAAALDELANTCAPSLPVLPVHKRWAPFAPKTALNLLAGETPVHTDLCAANILVTDRARFIDWAWPTLGAQWLDTALMIPSLILTGHTPASAQAWADRVPAWKTAPVDAVDALIQARLAFAQQRGARALHAAVRAWQISRSRCHGSRAP